MSEQPKEEPKKGSNSNRIIAVVAIIALALSAYAISNQQNNNDSKVTDLETKLLKINGTLNNFTNGQVNLDRNIITWSNGINNEIAYLNQTKK